MRWMKSLFVLFLTLMVMTGCGTTQIGNEKKVAIDGPSTTVETNEPAQSKSLTDFEEVASYIRKHHSLPDNFITKKDAEKLGWNAKEGNLNEVAPGKSIGGDIFRNREGKLPKKKGRIWYEADMNYSKGFRGKDRLLFSNDGLIYKTEDHYDTFQQMKGKDGER
ncbi:barnase [Paenibacillus sp. E194]|uniref:ribonuclease domain-containing protein n=1 Tax=Paenibacillus sp. E194 TaxID=1458845 RepID=UPI0005DE698B|nr:ribonuclease domain-containing protein [Paenibacillus sp. E194]KJB88981.1 barnase [Paenibacillus sp. E194]